jgi:O-antigen ligase/Tfp pilus assembly protein PilF
VIDRDRLLTLPAAVALFAVPLLYVRHIYDFTRWPRLLVLQVCIVLGLAGLVVLSGHIRRRGLFDTPVLAFVTWSAFSTFWAVNPIEAAIHLTALVTMVSAYGYVSRTCNEETTQKLVWIWAICGLLVALIGIGQYFGFDPLIVPTAGHPGSTFGYRNYVATYLAISIPVVTGFALLERSLLRSSVMLLSSALMLLLLLYTRTRGAWLGLSVAMVCAMFVVARTENLRAAIPSARTKLTLGVAAVVILLFAAPLQHRMARQGDFGFDERKADLSTTAVQVFAPSGARGRLTVWRRTLDMILDNPVFGVGLGAWMFHYPVYDQGEWITRNTAPQRPHNDFIWILSETGVIGLAIYLWIVGLIVSRLWRAENLRELALCSGALAYLGHSFFSFPRERIAATMLFWVALGMISTLRSSSDRSRAPRWPFVACCITLIFCTGVTARGIAFDQHFARAVNAWRREDWHSLVRDTQAAIDIGVINFRALQLNGLGHERLGQYDAAIESFSRSLVYHPNEGHLPLAEVRERAGDLRNALEGYRKEKATYPESAHAGDGIARTAAALGDSARAGKDWEQARFFYTEAVTHHDGDPTLHNRLGEADLMIGHIDSALISFERAVALAPENARYHNNVGAALYRMGRHAHARSAYLEAIGLDAGYARAHRNLGDLLLTIGDSTGAIDAYRQFIEHWDGDTAFVDHIHWSIEE